ncbi:hypothetical protein [uncultured Chryseobacterium sp.]|uniref:hypothetical protein n=1 Tax=uncultured Chryseobacterium sp. TaxID=259322 RepID=UPI0025DF829F|nr:hypothetical protein [uncultured Chryseobacterium sp.]
MANLRIKNSGYIFDKLSSNWELKAVNGNMHTVLSGNIDGWGIDKYILKSTASALTFKDTNNNILPVGTVLTLAQMNNDEIILHFDHTQNGEVKFKAFGQAVYDITLYIQSTV